MTCWLCDGSGRWDQPEVPRRLICPVCRPREAEHQALITTELSGWLLGWEDVQARHHGPRFQVEPWLLVIHSGEKGAGVAEYFEAPDRKVSAHFAWSSAAGGLVQCVPLSHVAWHCGGSRYQGRGRLNFCSIGIELPGPWDKARDEAELGELRRLVEQLAQAVPSLRVAVRHSDIDGRKRDPGPGFTWSWAEGLWLEIAA